MNQFKYIKFAEWNPSNILYQKRNSDVVFKSFFLGKKLLQDQTGLEMSARSILDSGAKYPKEEYPGEIYLKQKPWRDIPKALYPGLY